MSEAVERILGKPDTFPYLTRIDRVMASPVCTLDLGEPLERAISEMTEQSISSVVVERHGRPIGIVTERDVLRALATNGKASLLAPVEAAMTSPIETIQANAYVYQAIGRLDRLSIRHLPVVSWEGTVVGMVSARALLRHRAAGALAIGDAIATADGADALSKGWREAPGLADTLLTEGATAMATAALLSGLIRDITSRAAELALDLMETEAPAPFAVMVLGSGGRGESLLAPDQDNALVWDGPDDLDPWFAEFGEHLCAILDEAGIPFCKGGVMASREDWRGSLDDWRQRISGWISKGEGESVLSVDIFYDMQPVYGDQGLAERLHRDALVAASGSREFLRGFASHLSELSSPIAWSFLGLKSGFRTQNGRVDLKMGGSLPIVTAARVLALKQGLAATATPDRLAASVEAERLSTGDGRALGNAFELVLGAILRQQIYDLASEQNPSTLVDVKRMTSTDRGELRSALRHLDGLYEAVNASLSD
ncbi:MAG: CBS domain-containing protein [Rhodospirillaceae bacterium]|jgi:CBS domain-containing protein|nr:CBS domain-containing protein [Rhodospirillaceae bacterium]MBT6139608.1 CBS domain-containing protein [Rhodospirillaceae bacterium]